jgi:hypothetical protein
MNRQSVNSSNITSIGYNPKTQILEIEFHSGGVYRYYSVPNSEYQALMNASSHGKYFDQNIKKTYQYSKIS